MNEYTYRIVFEFAYVPVLLSPAASFGLVFVSYYAIWKTLGDGFNAPYVVISKVKLSPRRFCDSSNAACFLSLSSAGLPLYFSCYCFEKMSGELGWLQGPWKSAVLWRCLLCRSLDRGTFSCLIGYTDLFQVRWFQGWGEGVRRERLEFIEFIQNMSCRCF